MSSGEWYAYFVKDLVFTGKHKAATEKGAAKYKQHVRENGAEQSELHNAYHSIFKSENRYDQLSHVTKCSIKETSNCENLFGKQYQEGEREGKLSWKKEKKSYQLDLCNKPIAWYRDKQVSIC